MLKRDMKALGAAIAALDRGLAFLASDRVQVSTLFGGEFVPIAKDIGSDLCLLDDARRRLVALHESNL